MTLSLMVTEKMVVEEALSLVKEEYVKQRSIASSANDIGRVAALNTRIDAIERVEKKLNK